MRDYDLALGRRDTGRPAYLRAAEYVRMSTDQQRYSTTAQSEAIHCYAAERGMVIVKSYEDAGKSGLSIEGRRALTQLLGDVQSGQAGFDVVIVYDVSRWGRFQDTDESAYYEFLCRQHGIQVEYCAEQFANDGSPLSAVIKGIKRAMAGEYSRELSGKVYAGQARLIRKGYRQGGQAGYGLRRTLIAEDGSIKGALNFGDRKCLMTDRVILTPGHPDEVAVVRQIFRLFVHRRMNCQEISDELNQQSVPYPKPGPWTRPRVAKIVRNVVYAGDSIWGKTSGKLARKRCPTAPDTWVLAHDVFEPIVDRTLFEQAQSIISSRVCKLTDAEIVAGLRQLYAEHGTLSAKLIDNAPYLPEAYTVSNRFDGLLHAYELAGHMPKNNALNVRTNRHLNAIRRALIDQIKRGLCELGFPVRYDKVRKILTLRTTQISVQMAKCFVLDSGNRRWKIRDFRENCVDVNIVIKMDHNNVDPLHYYMINKLNVTFEHLIDFDISNQNLMSYKYADFISLFTDLSLSSA